MKKRLLSLILAITVIASLLPTMALSASAADVGYTLNYDFGLSGTVENGTNIANYNDYAETDGRWRYLGKKPGVGTIYTYNSTHSSTGDGSAAQIKAIALNDWAAFEIYVPVTGKYTATLTYTRRNASAGCGNSHVYILDGATTDIEAALASATPLSDTMTLYDTGANRPNQTQKLNATAKNLTAGKYIIVFRVEEAGAQGKFHMYPQALTLTSGTLAAPMYGAKAVLDKTEMFIGDTANITISGPMSDNSDIASANITYSSDNACATVVNGVVTGVSEGTANITTYINGVALAPITIKIEKKVEEIKTYAFTYSFSEIKGVNGTEAEYTSYADTGAMWQMNTKSRESLSILKSALGIRIRTSAGYWASFKINVPASGKYNIFLNHQQLAAGSTVKAGYGDVYLLDGDTTDIENALETATPINTEEVAYASAEIERTQTPKTKLCEDRTIEKGEYILVLYSTRKHPDCHNEAGMYPMSLVLEGEAAKEAYAGAVSLAKSELTAGERTTAETLIFNTETNSAVAGDVTYKSSDEKVAKVDGNSVKAIGAGTAEIIAEYSGALASGNIVSAPITVIDSTDDSVIFGKATNVNSKIEIDGTLRRGDTVILNAEDIEGYEFIGWKRGNAVTGKFIAGAPQKNFEYKVYSNAFVTAIYEEKNPGTAKGVELWNQNGELIAKYDAEEFKALSKLPTPTLIGYEFVGYKTGNGEEFKAGAELSNGITHAVAEFEPISVSGPFYCDDVQNEIADSMKFNSPIIASTTSSTFSCWVRNNMVVSYDKDYTYYVWSAADINNSKMDVPNDKKPIVILEEGYGAYTIEYDAADYTIVEAGIIAGNGTPTVGSAPEKHIAQNVGRHGQFATKLSGDYENVRGYVIYIDGTTFKIAYSD